MAMTKDGWDALAHRLGEKDPVARLVRRVQRLEQELTKAKIARASKKRAKFGRASQSFLNELLPRLRQRKPHEWADGLTTAALFRNISRVPNSGPPEP